MKTILATAAAAAAFACAAQAQAGITVDGTLDAGYAHTATVTYNALAPEGNFAAPTSQSDAIGYDVYLASDASNVYGYLQTFGAGAAVADFANLYFDLDPANGNGSDIGFEVTNSRGFVAGGAGDYSAVSLTYYANNGVIEFSIPNSYFMVPLAGLAGEYDPNQQFAAIGDRITLRLSQSFGYSVAGGQTYGDNRLGAVTLGGAVPEPATWSMMILGFLGAGVGLRARRRPGVAA